MMKLMTTTVILIIKTTVPLPKVPIIIACMIKPVNI